jgi:DNA-binding NarL/FixJ family response regulator
MGVHPGSVNFAPLLAELRKRPSQIAAALDGASLAFCSGSRALLGAWLGHFQDSGSVNVVGAVTTAGEALCLVVQRRPYLLVCTDRLEEGDAVNLVERIKREHPATHTLLLVSEERRLQPLRRALAAGCDGICLESRVGQGTLLAAVQSIRAGGRYTDSTLYSLLRQRAGDGSTGPEPRLTTRECEVLEGLQQGLSNREIASQLFLSVETVRSHVRSLRQKLGARGRGHAAVIGLQRGLID